MSTTTIDITANRATINTPGFGFNALYRSKELHAELWQWHEAVAAAISNHHAEAMGHFFPCLIPEPTIPPGDVESPFEPYRGEGWADDLLEPSSCKCIDCGGTESSHSPTCVWMNELHGAQGPDGPGNKEDPILPPTYHPTLVCDECGDDKLVLSHEEGHEWWYLCDCGTYHRPRVNPDLPEGFSPVSHL